MASAPLDQPPTTPDLDAARNRADKLTGPYPRPPIPVVKVARSSQVLVVPETFNALHDKVAGICRFDSGKIHVNIADPPEEQSYTIAHELGHWVLHRSLFLKNPSLYSPLPRYRDPPPTPLEIEAQQFADHLLVPRRLLAPVRSAPPTDLARIFAVPLAVIKRRLDNA